MAKLLSVQGYSGHVHMANQLVSYTLSQRRMEHQLGHVHKQSMCGM